jgi:cell division septation protein DedD
LPKNDEGEFELVLGNRQLISVFVIVVVLLGVFFSMGYIVGRNSPAGAAENARNEKPKPEQSTDSSDSTSPETSEQTATPPPADAPLAATPDSAPSTPPAVTKPAQPEAPLPLRAQPEPARAKETKPKPSPTPPPATPTQHAAAAGDPASGEYWQVVATARPDAEIIAEALGKKGFHVVLSPAPKDGIFRVLVGPLADAPTQAQTRIGLESAGFKNPIMRKY